MKTYIWLIILLLLPLFLNGWNSTGHMIIAAIAYDQMSTELQLKVRDILREHPLYEVWMEEMPEGFNEGAFLMIKSSRWPDQIRRSDDPYDHPEWHYVNFFIHREDGTIDTTREDPDNDIIFGIGKSIEYLKSSDPETRAAYLAWLNHLVADIHQPMHCASVTSEAYPEGDRGGNRHWVKTDEEAIKLHFYWDMLPGRIADPNDLKNAVVRLTSNFPDTDYSLDQSLNQFDWAVESLNIAYEKAHDQLRLPVAYTPADAKPLTAEYNAMAQEVYKERVMQAAYRLKIVLESVLIEDTDE